MIQTVMKESQHADHAIIEIHMTRTANEDLPSMYIYIERSTKSGEDFPQKT